MQPVQRVKEIVPKYERKSEPKVKKFFFESIIKL